MEAIAYHRNVIVTENQSIEIWNLFFRIRSRQLKSILETAYTNKCGRGEIGRRTRFRFWRREAWGFKSLRPQCLCETEVL